MCAAMSGELATCTSVRVVQNSSRVLVCTSSEFQWCVLVCQQFLLVNLHVFEGHEGWHTQQRKGNMSLEAKFDLLWGGALVFSCRKEWCCFAVQDAIVWTRKWCRNCKDTIPQMLGTTHTSTSCRMQSFQENLGKLLLWSHQRRRNWVGVMKRGVRVKGSVASPKSDSFISCTVVVPDRRGVPTA